MVESRIKLARWRAVMSRLIQFPGALCLALFVGVGSSPALAQPQAQPKVWAILVGVDRYEHLSGTEKRTAVTGANQVRQWLLGAGWDRANHLLLSDFGSPDPGRPDAPASNILPRKANLDWAFRSWLFSRAKPGDLVVFYFAGRSRAVVSPQGEQVDPQVDYYLLPADAAVKSVERTGWALDRAIDDCARRGLHAVCWLATSLEEPEIMIPPKPGNGPAPESIPTGTDWVSRLARWPAITAWLASGHPSRTVPSEESGSRFTQALLNSLGKPDDKPRRNLAATLKDLQQDASLMLQGFRSIGGVPPALSLWKDEFASRSAEPTPELVLQFAHSGKLTGVAATGDGRLIITASVDSTVRVWSAQDGSLLRVLPGYSAEVGVTAMALSHDDRWLITGGGRGTVMIYDVEHEFHARLVSRQPHTKRIEQIALLPDGFHFVSLDRDGRSYLWDIRESPQKPKIWIDNRACRQVASGGRFAAGGKDNALVIAWCDDRRLHAFDSTGSGNGELQAPEGPLTAIAVSPDGRFLAFGFSDGRVVIRDRDSGREAGYQAAEGPVKVRRLVFSGAGKVAVEHERGVRLLTVMSGSAAADSKGIDLFERSPQSLVFSPGGEYLAASTENVGALKVWRLAGDGPRATILDDPSAGAALLGFTGNSRAIITGDFGGGVALRPLDPRGSEVAWSFPAHTGKLQELSAAPGRRYLLLLDRKGSLRQSRIWDLRDRTCRQLHGTWSSGVFLDDDRLALIADSQSKEHAGRLVLLDRGKLSASPSFFARKSSAFEVPGPLGFERLTASSDGKWVAAAADSSKTPLVCVWETGTGKLTHWISSVALEDAVLSLSFSSDSRYLLSAGSSPAAKLWDLSARQGSLDTPTVLFAAPSIRRNVTCAAIRPGATRQVVTGHSDGQVHLWSWADGLARLEIPRLVEGQFAGSARSVCFTSDGGYLAAAGDGLTIWVGAMDRTPRPIEGLNKLRPHHSEQINTLATWKDLPVLISGGDDTTVRFWDLKNGKPWGTFAAAAAPVVADSAAIREVDWVFYTPEGLFDAPRTASKLVKFRRHDRAQSLDQFEKTHSEFGLSERMLGGEEPRAVPKPEEPPLISLSAPPRFDPTLPRAKLTITLGEPNLKDIRLYHNDVLVPSQGVGPMSETSLEVEAPLVPDRNLFYAMASREGAYDSCSPTVEVNYTGRRERGRVHVLAIGVGGYRFRQLKYAQDDVRQLNNILHDRGADSSGQLGESIVLLDDQVTEENIENAFNKIRRSVEDRPQDTVVVVLAGHSRAFKNPPGFFLLLPTYPFADTEPLRVATRGADDAVGAKIDPRFVLPYASIASKLSRLRALQRLVIVDACQAEAILVDEQVRAIERWMAVSSRRACTSYLMAARRGEDALEAGPLRHGLLTYALLRGMGAISSAGEPKEVAELGLKSNADFNNDGLLATSELDAYVKHVVPQLARIYSSTDQSAATRGRGSAALAPDQKADQSPRIQTVDSSFSLVPIR